MAAPLPKFNRWYCANSTGIRSIRLFYPEDVASIPRAYSVPNIEGDILLKPGKEFYTITPDPRSAGHLDELRTSEHGDYYEQSLSFSTRRLRVQTALLRARLQNQRVHAVFTDANDLTHLFPNLRLRQARASNPGTGYQGTRYEFRGSSVGPAVTINGSLLDDAPGTEENILILQPTTGRKFRLLVGPCGELITVPTITDDPTIEVAVGNYVLHVDDREELVTEPE